MTMLDHTEYAVEVYDQVGFVRQIDVFDTHEEAEDFIDYCNEPLQEDEYLNITCIDYDKHGNEIGIYTIC